MSLKSRGDLSLELLSLSRDVLSRSLERSLSLEDLSFEDLKSAVNLKIQVSHEAVAIKQHFDFIFFFFVQPTLNLYKSTHMRTHQKSFYFSPFPTSNFKRQILIEAEFNLIYIYDRAQIKVNVLHSYLQPLPSSLH